MKKKIVGIAIMSVFVLSFIFATMGVAQAFSWQDFQNWFRRSDNMNMRLEQKDPVTWEPIWGGSYGYLDGTHEYYLNFMGYDLEPMTRYTLIYYGFQEHNDEWPWATCIASGKTYGRRIYLSGYFNYAKFLDNGINEKFWLVKSSDVDCRTHKMTAWNPDEYLFEHETV